MGPRRHFTACLLFVLAWGSFAGLAGAETPQDRQGEEDYRAAPVADPSLDARLTRWNTFVSREGDTLVELARLLYGHSTWWVRLRSENPGLGEYGPGRKLRAGTRIRHRAPEIGDVYVVRPGDWLVRIAIWKYGTSESWSEKWPRFLARNESRLASPSVIRPGDRLSFSADGSIRNEITREVYLEGAGVAPGELFEEARILAALAEEESGFAGWAAKHYHRTAVALVTGLALLVLSLVGYLRSRKVS